MRRFASLAEFAAASGEHLGYSPWREVTQQQIGGAGGPYTSCSWPPS
jgi:hypothetical protein